MIGEGLACAGRSGCAQRGLQLADAQQPAGRRVDVAAVQDVASRAGTPELGQGPSQRPAVGLRDARPVWWVGRPAVGALVLFTTGTGVAGAPAVDTCRRGSCVTVQGPVRGHAQAAR